MAATLSSLWNAGNNEGMGYAIGSDDQTAVEAVEFDGLPVIGTEDGFILTYDGDHGLVVVADANGPWAIPVSREDVTDYLDAGAIAALGNLDD